ncbi:MAG TPA: alpha/beta hydrolase [Roseiarcus sp.]|nr:alpha/beta hydrolase [Roseiarcus sp.]
MADDASQPFDRFFDVPDGLRLHFLEWPGAGAPVLCLPGLTRSAEDFRVLAQALAGRGRRVIALDCRGRGESQWDPDYARYTLDVEIGDIFRLLEETGVRAAQFVGTSRGGLQTMLISQRRPELVRAAVLNDVGPKIHLSGLLNIKRYVGRLPPLTSIEDAVGLMRLTAGATFSNVTLEQWRTFARHTFVQKDGKVVVRFDRALAHTLDEVTPDYTPIEYWDAFAVLTRKPTLVLRGENSDILTPDILADMTARAPTLQVHVVAGQGHPALLLDDETVTRVVHFLESCLLDRRHD